MNRDIDPDLEQQITKSGLLASNSALRTALEAVIATLPHAAQLHVVAHLRKEADSLETSFDQEHPPARTEVPRQTRALRHLAHSLEHRHGQELEEQVQQVREQQWRDAGLQKAAPEGSPSTPPSQEASMG